MHILVGDVEGEIAVFDLGVNLPEASFERRSVLDSDDALSAEHTSVSDRAADIFAHQAYVECHRGVKSLQTPVRRLSEPPAPRLCCSRLLGHASSRQIADADVERPLPIAPGEGLG